MNRVTHLDEVVEFIGLDLADFEGMTIKVRGGRFVLSDSGESMIVADQDLTSFVTNEAGTEYLIAD